MTNEPEEIPDADHEQLIDRVAAIDVAKEFGKVYVRLADPARAATTAMPTRAVQTINKSPGQHRASGLAVQMDSEPGWPV